MNRLLPAALLLLAACEPARAPAPPTPTPVPAALASDLVAKYVLAAADPTLPMTFLYQGDPSGAARTGPRLEEYDAWCRGRGFSGFEQFLSTWGRVHRALLVLENEDLERAMLPRIRANLEAHQAELKRADLAPERRKEIEALLADSQRMMDDLGRLRGGVSVPAGDLEAVRPHQAALRAALDARKPR